MPNMSINQGEPPPLNNTTVIASSQNQQHIKNNISVTNIKCEDFNNQQSQHSIIQHNNSLLNGNSINGINNSCGNSSVRISVPKVEDSDESESELINIEQNSKVNRRTNAKSNGPRPMSWEGELSNQDGIDHMETDQSSIKEERIVIGGNDEVKPDFDQTTQNFKKFQQNDSVTNMKYEPSGFTDPPGGLNSPLLMRSKINSSLVPANPSPDSAIHSVYTHSSPSQSPLTSRHPPYTPSLSRNNSDASHSSCYSYSSEFSPTHSPIQGRHNVYQAGAFGSTTNPAVHLYRPMHDESRRNDGTADILVETDGIPSPGISRQQLINSPCPICGDKISGFHYGIFSCESCKGFFKRTVQNRKNYVCVRGGPCPVTISTRKKCPACRFDKCLQKGMKLEAIREDRTRGGRSTYQCSYTLPNPLVLSSADHAAAGLLQSNTRMNDSVIKTEDGCNINNSNNACGSSNSNLKTIPPLLQEIMDVEHLWQYNESELSRLNQLPTQSHSNTQNLSTNPLLVGLTNSGENTNPDLIATLCNVADHRLYKIVKWCKSLPLFKNISIDDQICLLINSWCELLLFSCCFRSIATPGEIKISLGKTITLDQAKTNGLQSCVERMLNLTDHLRRLRVDRYEYVAMKVIILLQSDTSELQEPVKVRESQEKALQALQSYTLAYYPDIPSKFGELLLRIPELQRTCQLGKDMLTIKSKDGDDFSLLMELLRGEH